MNYYLGASTKVSESKSATNENNIQSWPPQEVDFVRLFRDCLSAIWLALAQVFVRTKPGARRVAGTNAGGGGGGAQCNHACRRRLLGVVFVRRRRRRRHRQVVEAQGQPVSWRSEKRSQTNRLICAFALSSSVRSFWSHFRRRPAEENNNNNKRNSKRISPSEHKLATKSTPAQYLSSPVCGWPPLAQTS